MRLADLERDDNGWVRLPCGSLILNADSFIEEEHVPYCATCASQIDHQRQTGSDWAEGYPDCQKWPHAAVDCRGDDMDADHDPSTPSTEEETNHA